MKFWPAAVLSVQLTAQPANVRSCKAAEPVVCLVGAAYMHMLACWAPCTQVGTCLDLKQHFVHLAMYWFGRLHCVWCLGETIVERESG